MTKLIFRMNQSIDGYVDLRDMSPSPIIFRHWIEQLGNLTN